MAPRIADWDPRIGRHLKLRDLHVLIAVAKLGSMAKAAAHLSVTQPAISQAIADLERAVGVRLLDRGPRGVELTTYGQRLLQRGTEAFDALERRSHHRGGPGVDRRRDVRNRLAAIDRHHSGAVGRHGGLLYRAAAGRAARARPRDDATDVRTAVDLIAGAIDGLGIQAVLEPASFTPARLRRAASAIVGSVLRADRPTPT